MQKLKINKFYLALLALCITFYAQPMDRPEPRDMFVIGWASVVGSILLGASTLRDLLPSTHKQVLTESSNFIQLPKEIRNEIIKLVSLNNTAPSLEYAAKTINALSLVNKDLNETINDPIFCLKLIKHLSIKFDRANMDVCKILPIRAAHDRFKLQQKLYTLCKDSNLSYFVLNYKFPKLYNQNVDLEFTYTEAINNILMPFKKTTFPLTPLMIASINNTKLLPFLLDKPELAVINLPTANINATENKTGKTALMWAVKTRNVSSVQLLCKNKNIEIDKQDISGNTALMLSLLPTPYSKVDIDASIVQAILEAGANLELANEQKITPLEAAQHAINRSETPETIEESQKAYRSIKKAIDEKNK